MGAAVRIVGSDLTLQASHTASKQSSVKENLRIRVDPPASVRPPPPDALQVTLSAAAQEKQAAETDAIDHSMRDVENDPRMQLILLMIERMTGQKIRLYDAGQISQVQTVETPAPPIGNTPAPAPRAGFGVAYDKVASYQESEQTAMQATGSVRTSDGRKIEFSLQLTMQHQYSETSSTSVRMGDAARKTDPLIVNFNGTAAQLSNQRFAFDLNSDGKNEQINAPVSGTGFLALDLNGDGKISSGKELFGPASGDGFGELAQYDSDRNGWIDEADPVFEKLRVWLKAAPDQDRLASLASLGVGAISLNAIDTPFDLKNASNQLLGSVRGSSVYLNEDGSVGSVQQVDLVA
ncbi:MAG: VCBS repeat-containing protein [Proteobacteria bacterium]|nr:VCBS repeat-containing protein [Pseudomonadota bacterium]